jgi:glycosyltransferase involved in cell wall biosynthesis
MPGRPVSGGGLRAWGLGEALARRGHEVLYSMPRALVPDGAEFDEMRRLSFEPADFNRTLLRAAPDVLLIEQWGLATHIQETTVPIVLDLHGSLILENAFRQHRSLVSNAAAKIKSLHKVDLVICPGVRQRAYFMTWLMMSGADPRDLPIEVVPVSMPPDLLERKAPVEGAPLSLVFGGQLWPWIDAETALVSTVEVLEETGAGALDLFVDEPKRQDLLRFDDSTQVQARQIPERVRSSPAARVVGLVRREELLERYARADLAIDVYRWNTERELAYTTRTVEYLWCGLPVVYGGYGELADLIEKYQAGWLVPPDDAEAIRRCLREAVGDRAELARRSENARRLVRERLSWDRTIEPLDRFVQEPRVRPKGETIFGRLALEFDRIADEGHEQVDRLRRDLGAREGHITNLETMVRGASLEVAERDRRVATLGAELEAERGRARELEGHLSSVQRILQAEQDDHGQTSARLEVQRGELSAAQKRLAERDLEIDQLKHDLRTAVGKISSLEAEFEGRLEAVEAKARDAGQCVLDLRKDVVAQVAEKEELSTALDRARGEALRLREVARELERRIIEFRDGWVERTLATSEHTVRRAFSQVPALAGLFVRNLANNAYMTIWQKRTRVRIFPGQ